MQQNAYYPKVIIHHLGGSYARRPSHWLRRTFLAILFLVAATVVSKAEPFTVRPLPAGFDKTVEPAFLSGAPVMNPMSSEP